MNHSLPKTGRSAFTLVEVMTAMAIGTVVIAAAIHIHLWVGRIARGCEEKGWTQSRALVSSSKLLSVVHQAALIVAIDETDGNWVRLAYPGGAEALLAYTNSPTPNTGALVYIPDDGGAATWLVREGILNYSKNTGSVLPVFARVFNTTNPAHNAIQIQYMVIKPTSGDDPAENQREALNMSLTACLRNYVDPTP